MTELEQYKKAYATLTGRVDTIISKLEESITLLQVESAGMSFAAKSLTNALQEAEDIIVSEEPEKE